MSLSRNLRNRISSRITLTAAGAALALTAAASSGAALLGVPGQGPVPGPATAAAQGGRGSATPVHARPGAAAGGPASGLHRAADGTVMLAAYVATSGSLTPRQIAWRMMRRLNMRPRRQFKYLNWLWDRESDWNKYAYNPYSGAYGIPQAVPGSKMATAGSDWRTSARTQIRWGLHYIKGRYGTARAAWRHECATGWY